jgi:hypothetical protein
VCPCATPPGLLLLLPDFALAPVARGLSPGSAGSRRPEGSPCSCGPVIDPGHQARGSAPCRADAPLPLPPHCTTLLLLVLPATHPLAPTARVLCGSGTAARLGCGVDMASASRFCSEFLVRFPPSGARVALPSFQSWSPPACCSLIRCSGELSPPGSDCFVLSNLLDMYL